MLVDVGGENTDIGLFKDSVLQSLISVPHGTHHFVRELGKSCALDKNAAMSKLNLLYEDNLQDEECEKSKEILKKVEKKWLAEVQEAVEGEWNTEVIPPTIFMTVDNSASRLFKTIITSREGYTNSLKINREPIIHIMNNKTVNALCDYDKDVAKDSLLSIAAYFSGLEDD